MPPEPLSKFSPGQRVVVHTMPAEQDLTMRLRELGMHEGGNCEVTLRTGSVTGLKISGTTYALNRYVTDQILVEQYKSLTETVLLSSS